MPSYTISLSQLEDYECGAILIALLAYPTDLSGDKAREGVQISLCHLALVAKHSEKAGPAGYVAIKVRLAE